MKIVKYIFLLLLLTVIAVTVFIATQEGKYDIKKERVIKVPKTVLFNYINEYRNWENVGILTSGDSTAVYSYSDTTFGKDASMDWKKDGTEGKIKTIKLVESDSIIQKAVIDGLDSEIAWSFKDTVGGTKIAVRMKGQLSFKEKAYAVLKGDVDKKMETVLDNGLKNLNTFLVDEISTFNIDVKGLVTKTGMFYLGQPVTSEIADIQKKAGEIFPKLLSFIKTNKIATNGAPFILYKTFDKEAGTASYIISIPIKEEIYTAPGSEFTGGKLTAFQALKTTLKGDYSHLAKAWDAAQKHISENGLQEKTTGQYVELYSKGMQQTKRPSEWITDIYIPIGAPGVIPEEPAEEMLPGGIPVQSTSNATSSGTQQPRATGTATTPTGVTRPATNKPPGTSTSSSNTNKPASRPAGTSTGTGAARQPAQGTVPPQ